MTEIKTDINGRAYAQFSTLKKDDKVEVDDAFPCIKEGSVLPVMVDGDGGLYIECSEGKHCLDGQADDGENLVGLYPAA